MKNLLCFGDSNTWGYNPESGERYPWGIRWTSRLQEMLGRQGVRIIEEGLCGRTTVFEDRSRPDRRGIDALPGIFQKEKSIDAVILMLGTNDCKRHYKNSPKEIAKGVAECLDVVLQHVAPENILLVSPIVLGEDVWKEEFDPEFNCESISVSIGLKEEYSQVARRKNVAFLAASDYVLPSPEDQEHLNAEGHYLLADALYEKLKFFYQKTA